MPPKFAKDTSKTSSTDGGSPVKEENFVDALLSQVDEDNVDDIIKIQKKALERFEKTNEMLITCVALSEKRLERAKTEFVENKKLLVNAKSDLEVVFRKLRNMKQLLATKYPDIYGQIAEQNKPPAEEE
uniref:KxDL domain-containing protein n=1 Tax=Panagrellus redivivus TaxID=6233 RepID=A0A7E5A0J5_PANRE